MLSSIVKLLRPKQWAKNVLVFAAWLFAGKFRDTVGGTDVLLAFVAMCLASSAVYVFNDIVDAERDRAHPKKKNRPIASGAVPAAVAAAVGLVLLAGALGTAWSLNRVCLGLVLGYLAVQGLYNLWFKSVAVLDVFVVASGFVLRAVLGAAALALPTSGWFLICVGTLALMLGFAKRRNEFVLQASKAESSRESLTDYSQQALDMLVMMFATLASLSYVIYTVESSTARTHPSLIVTAPVVVYGVARYLLRVFRENEGGEPADLLFGDWHILASVVLFVVLAGLAIKGTLNLPFLVP